MSPREAQPQTLRDARNAEVARIAMPLSFAMGVVLCGFVALDLVSLQGFPFRVVVAMDAAVATLTLALGICIYTRRFPLAYTQDAVTFVTSLTILDAYFTSRIAPYPNLASHMFIALVGVSGVLLSWSRVAVIGGLTLTLWIAHSGIHSFLQLHEGIPPLVTFALATAVASSLHAGRMRSHRLIFSQETSINEALARASRELEERKRAEREREHYRNLLMQGHKMEALGTLAAGIAHDMNNVLTAIMSIGELMQEEYDPRDPAWEDVAQILSAARRGTQLTRDILAFSSRESPRKEPVDVAQLTRQVTGFLERTSTRHKTITAESEEALVIDADYGQMSQVLINLCTNALEAVETEGAVIVRSSSVTIEGQWAHALQVTPGLYARIDVIDNGVGMDEATQQRMFDPFFSTKSGGGTGLGLSLAYSTIRNHGGAIDVESKVGEGTRMSLYLPRSQVTPSVAALSIRSRTASRAVGVILLVDDEELVRRSGKRVLERLGYQAFVAIDGVGALEYLEQHRGEIDLVLLDVVMPGMAGTECAAIIRDRHPDVKIVLSSAMPANEVMESGDVDVDGWVQKPYSIDNLAETLLNALQRLAPVSHAAPKSPQSSNPPAAQEQASDSHEAQGRPPG